MSPALSALLLKGKWTALPAHLVLGLVLGWFFRLFICSFRHSRDGTRGWFAGMLGVTRFGIILTPVFYYVIQRFVDRRHPQAKGAAGVE